MNVKTHLAVLEVFDIFVVMLFGKNVMKVVRIRQNRSFYEGWFVNDHNSAYKEGYRNEEPVIKDIM